MKIVGIYGSPRKGGNTDLLLDAALEAAREAGAEVQSIYCRKLKYQGCIACGGCDKTGECVLKDDMQEVYPLWEEADAIILSAPVFFYNMPAIAKAMVDRSQACWSKRLLNKPKSQWSNYESGKGYLIGVGATKGKNLFIGMDLVAKYFFDAMDMSHEDSLHAWGVDAKGAINDFPDLIEQARQLGARAARGE